MFRGLLFFSFLAFISACKSGDAIVQSEVPTSIIILERTPCYGTCPVYKIQIESTGDAFLENKKFVEPLGNFNGKLNKKDLDALFQLFGTVKWASYKNSYDSNVSDLPTAIITWYHSGYTKVIRLRSNYPEDFDVLLKKIDQVRSEVDWNAPEK
jgi:hypothetical protein